MTPVFFKNQTEFRKWLKKNHKRKLNYLWVFYKVASGKPSLTWSESVDQALCFGWIDGVRYSLDKDSYTIRFTPRKKTSMWSAVNFKKMEKLIEQGLMQPEGLASFENRTANKSNIYAFENEEVKFSLDFKKQFKANKKAWTYFQSLAPSYRKLSSNWVMSAKQECTRLKRLHELIADSESGTNKWKHNKYKKK